MSHLRWAILGPGSIARRFAEGLKAVERPLTVVASRSLDRAQAFAQEYGGEALEGYDAALARPDVDAVYIALPHHLHAEWTIRAARAGKHILCEKPFTLNLPEAEGALQVVDACGVFFMEAWMYRSHPQSTEIIRLLRDGAIGTPRLVRAEFGFQAGRDWANFRTIGEVGGGALMDVGSYCVSFARMVAAEEPARAEYVCEITPQGYDAIGAGLLEFPSGLRASFGTAIHLDLQNQAVVYGDEGRLIVPSPWFADGRLVLERQGKEPEVRQTDSVAHLWGYQAVIVERYLESRESPTMAKADTLGNMATLDRLRRSAGLRFGPDVW